MWHICDGHHFGGMHFFWWLFWVIIILWAIKTSRKNPNQQVKDGTPLDILKKRFANGDVTKEEYEEMKKTIEKD